MEYSYCKAVGQCGTLGRDTMAHGGREASFDTAESGSIPQTPREVLRELSRGHDRG